MKKTILFGISGGIAAQKCVELVTALEGLGNIVNVILTESALQFVSPKSFTHAYTGLFDKKITYASILKSRRVEHINLADSAALFVVAPATANVIAKLAHGIADDYLTTVALAATCPVLVCPSMNSNMWNHPATQNNIRMLKRLGYHVLPPETGSLACGYEGIGRLPATSTIQIEIERMLNMTQSLAGKRVIVTTGGTTEPIDQVRTISNKSSGKMGIALAEACFLAGAKVTILRSETSVTSRYAIPEEAFQSASDLETLVRAHAPTADIFFHVAAVSDFSVKVPLVGKYSSKGMLPLELEPRRKILDTIKKINPTVFLIAFKAEYGVSDEELAAIALQRLKKSGADLIIANDIARDGVGFQSDENEVLIIQPDGTTQSIPRATKSGIANEIVSKLPLLME